jgi:hypothetical protein
MSASALRVTRRFSARARALDRGPLVVLGFTGGNGLLDILEGQMQLIRVELIRAPAKLHALQLIR